MLNGILMIRKQIVGKELSSVTLVGPITVSQSHDLGVRCLTDAITPFEVRAALVRAVETGSCLNGISLLFSLKNCARLPPHISKNISTCGLPAGIEESFTIWITAERYD